MIRDVKRHLLAGLLLVASLLAFACAEVKPWERGTLAEPPMNPGAQQRIAQQQFVGHVFDVREGSTGGTGTAGGGCGCN
jgi:hypothetical protein